MKLADFQKSITPAHRIWLSSEHGKAVLETLRGLRPGPLCEPIEHQVIYRHGVIAGYEQCLFDLIERLSNTPTPDKPISQDYGVKKKGDSA